MATAITDYVKFLTQARVAVDSLNCDQNTRDQMAAEAKRLDRELEAAKKAMTDQIAQTARKRREEISSGYDKEIAKGQEKLRKARLSREKAKNKGVKERIADETSELREQNRKLKLQMRMCFQQNQVPFYCNSTLYYALYSPRGLKEILILLLSVLICFLALPCLIYFMIPGRHSWYLAAVYFVDVVLFGGLYVVIGNRTKLTYQAALKEGRAIRNTLRSNQKKIRVITHSIEKDGNEDIYNLEKYDDEISCVENELAQIAERKKEALNTFETVTKNIISDEITEHHMGKIQELEQKQAENQMGLRELDARIREENIYITDTFGPYLGQEFLKPERLAELARLIQDGSATNLTEAMELYQKQESNS